MVIEGFQLESLILAVHENAAVVLPFESGEQPGTSTLNLPLPFTVTPVMLIVAVHAAELTVQLKVSLSVRLPSVTSTVTLYTAAAAEIVPVIWPVLLLMDKPDGRPEAE